MGEKSLEIDPTLVIVYYTMGGIYFENQQYERPEACPFLPDRAKIKRLVEQLGDSPS
ncbi:MAG TPA: tetratricopeptide repeat protein [Thermodesulfobacteriota bacterium]|nr:tetratricopeptide repeat protein [Thermodesulfobacteriota bacterium]